MRTAVRIARGLRFVLTGVLLAGMTACATSRVSNDPYRTSLPLSNRQVAERVISQALENLGIPEGNGREVSCRVERTGTAGDPMLDIMAVEFLARRGYRVRTDSTIPEFRFGTDSLAVDLTGRGSIRARRVERHAEASVVAVFRESPDARKTYRAFGVYEDSFPAWASEYTGRSEPFVNDHRRSGLAVKPFFFGLIVTGLVWLLYTYRG